MVEGPFGDHTGFYSEADLYPKVHVTAVTMRKNTVYGTTIVGRPPMEDFYLGHATERIFLPLLKLTTPEIVDYHMPAEGIFHNLVFVIDRQAVSGARLQGDECAVGGRADVAGQGARGRGQGSERAQLRRRRGGSRSTTSTPSATRASRWGRWMCSTTPRAPSRYGSKMGIDATRKWPEEGFTRNWPQAHRDGRRRRSEESMRCGGSSG